MSHNFIPVTIEEVKKLGWKQIDIIIISGDAYVDHPAFGAAIIARVLESHGFRVVILPQPDIKNKELLLKFGKPRLFYGVTSGNIDSMLSKYTAFKKVRNEDAFTPDNEAAKRPERAVIAYCNLIKQAFKDVPIIIGGVEASMRRFAHYDFWSNKVRRSIIEDSRADLLVYGMGEYAIVETAKRLEKNEDISDISGTLHITREKPANALFLPDEEHVISDKKSFSLAFKDIYLNQNRILAQKTGNRYLVQYPAAEITTEDLDKIYRLPFTRQQHPIYGKKQIAAANMIQFSINSHRGCAAGCAFCSISLHQGRRVVSRSKKSILDEAQKIANLPWFKGHITDVGGPSANMYNSYCKINNKCNRESCLYPNLCKNFKIKTNDWVELLKSVSKIKKVKHVTLGSGIRYDLLMRSNPEVLRYLVRHHVSGQLKIAPEHTRENVLKVMRKVPIYNLRKFVTHFQKICKEENKKYYIVSYFMSNHPACRKGDMVEMHKELKNIFKFMPDQVQSFIPLPMTLSSVIYYTGYDPLTGEKVFSEKEMNSRYNQHRVFFKRDR